METILVAKATEELVKEVNEDLKIPDPDEETIKSVFDEQSETKE